jgi:NRPS condensation-like uncharacterized protein
MFDLNKIILKLLKRKNKKNWISLDTVARIYPAIIGTFSPTSYRISVVLKEEINCDKLKEAVKIIIPKFPYFRYKIKAGIFWYFLQETYYLPNVSLDDNVICRDFWNKKKEKLLFRILYKENRISLECSHILSDGRGALEFFKYLIEQYLICSNKIKGRYLIQKDFSGKEFLEDSYKKFFMKDLPKIKQTDKAFQINSRFRLQPFNNLRIIFGEIETEILKEKAKKYQTGITQYLAATYIWALYNIFKQKRVKSSKSIRLIIPVDLRELYPSQTLRNFFVPVICEIMPFLGRYSWEEILEEVKIQMAHEIKPKLINLQIARNVSLIKNIFIRIIPLFIKLPIQRFIYFNKGIKIASGILSNLGKINLPLELEEHIQRFEFINSPNHILKVTSGIVGYKNKIIISFGSYLQETDLEREFFTHLSKQGIKAKIYQPY